MIFKAGEDSSYTLPLSGTLASHQTAGFITSHFNCVPSKLACPSFVVIDSSAALLNSVLSSFNVETVRSNLRRCFNTLNFAYNTSQLRDMTFVRLCCSHVMKVFSRSLNKIETSKDARRQITTLFAVLLNCHNVDGAFDLFEEIINIYADLYNNQSSQRLSLLLDQSNVDEFPVEPYLEEDEEEPHFLDEIDITADAIIHQSPFNVKACDRIPVLKQLIRNESTNKKPTNPLFSIEIVHLFYKWFAYIPLWSSIMTEFVDIYANDGKRISANNWEFGHGRISNASIESYFSVIKESVLMKKTRLKPDDFLLKVYRHTVSRLKANNFDVTQSSRCRKMVRGKSHSLNVKEPWSRKGRSKTKANRRAHYFDPSITQTTACKLTDTCSSNSSTHLAFNQSFGFSIKPSNPAELNSDEAFALECNSSSSSCSNFDGPLKSPKSMQSTLPTLMPYAESSETKTTGTEQNIRRSFRHRTPNSKYVDDYVCPIISPNLLSRILSPKRPLSSSNDTISANVTKKTSHHQGKKRKQC
ncbi:unnamed protein product [Rotaria sp. Silwood2]|nr:unnamed protein product [Rotaria sp. Silwood2]